MTVHQEAVSPDQDHKRLVITGFYQSICVQDYWQDAAAGCKWSVDELEL